MQYARSCNVPYGRGVHANVTEISQRGFCSDLAGIVSSSGDRLGGAAGPAVGHRRPRRL